MFSEQVSHQKNPAQFDIWARDDSGYCSRIIKWLQSWDSNL
jgi:hypothetical protein